MTQRDDRETVICEVVDTDGWHRYAEFDRDQLVEVGMLYEAVGPEEEARIRERWDGNGDVNLRVFPDRDDPLGKPFSVEWNDETGEYETIYEKPEQ